MGLDNTYNHPDYHSVIQKWQHCNEKANKKDKTLQHALVILRITDPLTQYTKALKKNIGINLTSFICY